MSLHDADRAALLWARTHGHGGAGERVAGAISAIGEHGAGWLALGVLASALDRPRRREWLRGVRLVGLSYAANQALKVIVRRMRPELAGLPPLTRTVSNLSFPSAHATTSFAAARAYAPLAPALALYTVAGLVALSRPYLGVHYPSDVLAGALLGTLIGECAP